MPRKLKFPACAFLVVTLAACSQQNAQQTQYRPTATIQDLMGSVIDPSADILWEAVSYRSTLTGTEDKQPRTDEEWAEVRARAIMLMEGTNLLIMPGRRVGTEGKKLFDEGLPGNLTKDEIQKNIEANRESFIAAAYGLHDAAQEAIAAADAKSVSGIEQVGEKIDMACEACHLTFWYPNEVEPVKR